MKFARVVFAAAGVWGFLVLTPLFFMFDAIGRQDPPPITHPGLYYGFVTTALAWQVAFLVIASNPIRYRVLMIPSMLEKFGYITVVVLLFLQNRVRVPDLVLAMLDLLFGVSFVAAFAATGESTFPSRKR